MGPFNTVSIRTTDGRTLERTCRTARGDPSDPLTRQDIRKRFAACTVGILPDERIDRLFETLEHLETMPDVGKLMPLFAL
jgi:2-methylcitrate dehydratase PrpD